MFTSILQLDGGEHSRLRGLVSKVFTARRVEAMRADVRRIAADLTATLAGRDGPVDLIEAWALPLPSRSSATCSACRRPTVPDSASG